MTRNHMRMCAALSGAMTVLLAATAVNAGVVPLNDGIEKADSDATGFAAGSGVADANVVYNSAATAANAVANPGPSSARGTATVMRQYIDTNALVSGDSYFYVSLLAAGEVEGPGFAVGSICQVFNNSGFFAGFGAGTNVPGEVTGFIYHETFGAPDFPFTPNVDSDAGPIPRELIVFCSAESRAMVESNSTGSGWSKVYAAEVIVQDSPITLGACAYESGALCFEDVPDQTCNRTGGVYLGDDASCPSSLTSTFHRLDGTGYIYNGIDVDEATFMQAVGEPMPGFEGPLEPCRELGACLLLNENGVMYCDEGTMFDCIALGGNYLGEAVPCTDCNSNGTADSDDLMMGGEDCNENNFLDACEVVPSYAPAGDEGFRSCEDSTPIQPGVDYTSNSNADNDVLVRCDLQINFRAREFNYIPRSTGAAFATVTDQGPSTFMISVHDGCPTTQDNQIACIANDVQGLGFNVEKGKQYVIRVGGVNQDEGQFTLSLLGPDAMLTPYDDNLDGVPDDCECREDVNMDWTVDTADFLQALGEQGNCILSPPGCPSDVNQDGVVDVTDLMLIIQNMGPCIADTIMNPALQPRTGKHSNTGVLLHETGRLR
ncbi:MAG: hypothetical protein AAF432_12150 [Planctomycetota bacterium]